MYLWDACFWGWIGRLIVDGTLSRDTLQLLNPKCHKARGGVTFRGTHVGPTLKELIQAAGHVVPEVVLDTACDGSVYQESCRHVDPEAETELHMDLVTAL